MKIKSAKSFRFWYKTEVKKIERKDSNYNENFVGTYHNGNDKKTIKGFFEMYHGHKPDIAGYLPSILKIAEDGQAIYEFLQNAVDCGSTHFYIFYNEKYFLAINNGSPFDIKGLESILNIAQTTKKDPDKIGRFGIGFKLAHRLVGKNEGTDELVRQYKGPILFSWAKLKDLESLLNNERIEPITPQKGVNNGFFDAPYLLKLLLTNFPSDPNETVKDINYKDKVLFPKEELNELIGFLNENFKNHSDSLKKNVLNQGSLFFIKLGEDKKKLLDKDYSELVNGIQYSMNTLKKLQKVYINNDDIGKIPLQLEEGAIIKGSDEFEKISPEYKEFDIKFAIGFNTIIFGNDKSYGQIKLLKAKPNFYKYFPMGDEINGFGFIVHCDSFSNEANRRKLHEDDVNRNLFPVLAKHITQQLAEYRTKDRNKFLNLYASLLMSDIPDRQNNKWLRPIFYDVLLNSLQKNVPTKNGFLDNAQNVKINKLKINLNLYKFGLHHIQWFEWNNEADKLLIDEATKSEKLGIEEWDIRDIVENADLESIDEWIASCNESTHNSFITEIEKSSYLRDDTKNRLLDIKLFEFSDGNFYSVNGINQSIIFNTDKTSNISNELQKLGFVVSLENIKTYEKIYNAFVDKLPKEKDIYNAIAEKCKTNTLSAEEKKKLFLNFINEETKFESIADETLKTIHLFCNSQGNIKPLSELIGRSYKTYSWLSAYMIEAEEYFPKLKSYLIQEEEIFDEIILPNIEIIKDELTETKEIKELITIYKENHRPFFNEYIIQKDTNGFAIIDKSDKYQIIPSKDERKVFINFIETYLSDSLVVLPYNFSDFNDQDGILKGEKLHSQILGLIDIDEHKEVLVDIIHYNETKRKLIREISEFRFNSEVEYTKEDYEYKILELACNELKEIDFQTFRNKVIIKTGARNFNLSEIPPIADKIKIDTEEFSLSKILPSTYQNNNLISDLILQFEGIPREKLNALFGVSEEPELSVIFQMFSEQVETLENPEQFFFLIYYRKDNPNVDLSKLGFHLTSTFYPNIYPSDFALEEEKLPQYLQEWIEQDRIKISSLESIGILTENSTLVSLRKFFLTKSDFNLNAIARDEKLSEARLFFNTFEWIKEKEIKLNENEFEVFKEMVRVANLTRPTGKFQIQEDFIFELLEEKSKEWKTVGDFSVLLFDGSMPKAVKLNFFDNYVFYRYNDSDYAVNGKNIYINENEDKTKILQKVALDSTNSFTSEDSKDIELSEVKAELEKYKKQDQENSDFWQELDELNLDLNIKIRLKQKALDIGGNLDTNLQHQQNLLAKIALLNHLGKEDLIEEIELNNYNNLNIEGELYKVYSSKSEFAHIQPTALLMLKESECKIAIYYGAKNGVKLFTSIGSLFDLNDNHIFEYQTKGDITKLLEFLDTNNIDRYRYLLINPYIIKSYKSSENKKVEIDNEASNLI